MLVEDAELAAPRPLPVPGGEWMLRMRWARWGVRLAAITAVALGPAWLLVHAALAGRTGTMIAAGCLVLALVLLAALSLAVGRRVAAHGSVAALDAQGFRHCLLPAIPWKHVGGIDLERQGPRAAPRWHLVLAVEPAFARTLALPLLARMAYAPMVRVDASGRLTVPLAHVQGEPRELAGRALAVADRWGAPRVGGWRAWQDPARSSVFAAQWKLLRGAKA